MGALSEKIASTNDTTTETIHVPEWDVTIEVRSLPLGLRNSIIQGAMKDGKTEVTKIYAGMVIASCYVPETGEKAFDGGDMAMLSGKNGKVLDRLAKLVLKLSGADEEDQQMVVDAAGKGSSSTGSFDFGSL